jgi:uroporphyrinogen-III synthase
MSFKVRTVYQITYAFRAYTIETNQVRDKHTTIIFTSSKRAMEFLKFLDLTSKSAEEQHNMNYWLIDFQEVLRQM